MIDRSHIGHATTPTTVQVGGWRVKLFCRAVGETDPLYHHDAVARAAGHPACLLPPTYLKAIEGEHCTTAALLILMNVPLAGVLHAEQRFEHFAPVHVGDAVEVGRRVVDIRDGKGGAYTFVVVDTDFAVGGTPVACSRQTILVRYRLPAAAAAPAA